MRENASETGLKTELSKNTLEVMLRSPNQIRIALYPYHDNLRDLENNVARCVEMNKEMCRKHGYEKEYAAILEREGWLF